MFLRSTCRHLFYYGGLRMRIGEAPRYEETNQVIDESAKESVWTRLEKFKKWAKENIIALSGVAIMGATLITAIIAAVRSTAKKVASGVSMFGKGIAA